MGTAGCLSAIGKYLPRQQHEAFVPNCGADFLNSSGVLVSPNYPANYSGNLRCRWTVYAPGATRMGIVVEVETEAYFDKLFVLRSEQEGCRPLAKGGESIVLEEGGESIALEEGGVFYLSSNAFSVYFFSDDTVAAQGFRIFWYAIEV